MAMRAISITKHNMMEIVLNERNRPIKEEEEEGAEALAFDMLNDCDALFLIFLIPIILLHHMQRSSESISLSPCGFKNPQLIYVSMYYELCNMS